MQGACPRGTILSEDKPEILKETGCKAGVRARVLYYGFPTWRKVISLGRFSGELAHHDFCSCPSSELARHALVSSLTKKEEVWLARHALVSSLTKKE